MTERGSGRHLLQTSKQILPLSLALSICVCVCINSLPVTDIVLSAVVRCPI